MILVYQYNQKLVFLEKTYYDKGKRLGTLIEGENCCWDFHACSGAVINEELLMGIADRAMRLKVATMRQKGHQELIDSHLPTNTPRVPYISLNDSL